LKVIGYLNPTLHDMLEKDVRDFFFKTKENYNLVAGQKELYIDGLRIDIFAVDKNGKVLSD
jgi:hypothetical protein